MVFFLGAYRSLPNAPPWVCTSINPAVLAPHKLPLHLSHVSSSFSHIAKSNEPSIKGRSTDLLKLFKMKTRWHHLVIYAASRCLPPPQPQSMSTPLSHCLVDCRLSPSSWLTTTIILGCLFLQESSGFLFFLFRWHFFHRNQDSCSAEKKNLPPQESCLYRAYGT
jgi:hypothetical protein